MSKTYTQDELDVAIAEAVAALDERVKELTAAQEHTEIESRFAKEKADLEELMKDLQGQLDTATLKVSEAEKRYDELVAYLEALRGEQEAATELARRQEERLAVVREIASFSDEYLEANAERWAALTDEDFAALVEDWKAICANKSTTKAEENTEIPKVTAMVASRQDPTSNNKSLMREVMDLGLSGVQLSSL